MKTNNQAWVGGEFDSLENMLHSPRGDLTKKLKV